MKILCPEKQVQKQCDQLTALTSILSFCFRDDLLRWFIKLQLSDYLNVFNENFDVSTFCEGRHLFDTSQLQVEIFLD